MHRRNDAFKILRAHDPVDEATVGDADSPKARALFAEIVATPRSQPNPVRLTRRRLVIAVAAVLLAIVTAAATWLYLRDISDPISVGCYQDASLDSDVVAVASGGALGASLCDPVWEDGTLTNSSAAPDGQVPPLVGCVTDTGTLAVFPSNDENLCQTLGLADPNPESIPEGDAIRQLNDDLVAHFAANECQPIEEAAIDVRDILDGSGFEEWDIAVSPGGPGRPCTSFGLDAPNQTIHLIPLPPSS